MQHYENYACIDKFGTFHNNSFNADCGNHACAAIPAHEKPPRNWRREAYGSVFTATAPDSRVVFVPTAGIFESRHRYHPDGHGRFADYTSDCTHYCWNSRLWQPVWERVAYALISMSSNV
jgi:hypothetical protein